MVNGDDVRGEKGGKLTSQGGFSDAERSARRRQLLTPAVVVTELNLVKRRTGGTSEYLLERGWQLDASPIDAVRSVTPSRYVLYITFATVSVIMLTAPGVRSYV